MVISQDKSAMPGADVLAILISSDKHLDHVVNLTTAAFAKGKKVRLFFTGKGVLLTLKPKFNALVGKAVLSICDVCFRANGLHGREHEVPGVKMDAFSTQAKNDEVLNKADRHLVF
ncbi:DsrE family protein [Desulfosarcina sp.]|uniref:DsrE family protein n=1 Tax=Desulfosarcina sp. TaxID=2027861 RepID=UPI00299FFD3D|nr:DsrE family protein [Desulfosarcina sp.]MDX2454866.1 DsrE family protein [Desulfosarcina sp.]